MEFTRFSELLKTTDKTTNIQKPPVYKHILPRVLETTTNNHNNRDKNVATKLSLSPSSSKANKPVYDIPSDINKEERQSRVDRILEKYRRPSSSSVSREFSRSFSCNSTTESLTESNFLNAMKTTRDINNDDDNKRNSGPRSVSPYALFDRSDLTSTTPSMRQEIKANATNSLLPKSYSLKSLGEYRYRTLTKPLSVDQNPLSKSNGTHVNYDEDPPSSASSTSSTNTAINSKILVSKGDDNHYCSSSALIDWTVGNCCEETVSDRIKRRSYYVKLK